MNIISRTDFNSYIDHPGSVVGFCRTIDGQIILINTKRNGKPFTLELPGGNIEQSEDALTALHREIKEETGCTVINSTPIGEFYTSGGITNEIVTIYSCLITEPISTGEHDLIKISDTELSRQIKLGHINDFRIVIAENHLSVLKKDIDDSYSRLISLWSIQESLLQIYRSVFITVQSLLFSISAFIATTEKPYFSTLLFPIALYLLWFGFKIIKKRGFGVWFCILHLHKLDKGHTVSLEGFILQLHSFMELTDGEKKFFFTSDEVGQSMLSDKTRRDMDYNISFFFLLLWIILLGLIIFIKYLPFFIAK